ncbi:MAG: flagellar biosynthesis anti-sigma factor FlgM [Ferrovum sp.]|nr:flagellar biosynthesis anti-sigma factor FlgM [Ferrovum sp.]NDU88060.1 flagellar biosynthesis anti-sigma factor FlgM [Ferrovum sp.]
MKIDKTIKSTTAPPVRDGGARPTGSPSSGNAGTTHQAPTSGASASAGTTVHIGGSTNQLQSAVASAPSVDLSKVSAVRQAISEGRFQVNAHAVAQGLITSVTNLIQQAGGGH